MGNTATNFQPPAPFFRKMLSGKKQTKPLNDGTPRIKKKITKQVTIDLESSMNKTSNNFMSSMQADSFEDRDNSSHGGVSARQLLMMHMRKFGT
jgi:hypothetical protein